MRKCKNCEKGEDEARIEYHSSPYRVEKHGHGLFLCSGCHKTQHRMEKKYMLEENG